MAHETVTKSKRFYCVSLTPDICKTPVGNSVVPLPYNITGEFKDAQAVSKDVKTHSEPVFLHDKSFIPSVKGDERGTLGGIKSGTFLKRVESLQFSPTKGSNGTQTIQESRLVWMNDRNTVGRVLERQVQPAKPRLKVYGFEVSEEIQENLQAWRDKHSADSHAAAGRLADTSGDLAIAAGGMAVGGAVAGATVIGAPVGAALEVGALVTGGTAGAVGVSSAVVETGSTVIDKVADLVLDGKTPDYLGTGLQIIENVGANALSKKFPGAGQLWRKLFKKEGIPGKTPAPPKKPPADNGKDKDGSNGGKVKQEKPKKEDKPAACCPINRGPGGKSATSRKPVHFGTGEEILYQEDFAIDGPTPLVWGRTYRSGSETEDWSMLGSRWSLAFNSGVSICSTGMVFHDDTGRAVRLPLIDTGEEYIHRGEGFTLRRDSASRLTLIWRDGTSNVFERTGARIFPHGYEGVNAILLPRAPVQAEHFALAEIARVDGRRIAIERFLDAEPGSVMLRVRTADGLAVEAIRGALLPSELADPDQPRVARVGRVEQLLGDGTRTCHATYDYAPGQDGKERSARSHGALASAFDLLPPRVMLVRQADITGQDRAYSYASGLLVHFRSYNGFEFGLEWVSLEFLRERWSGNRSDEAQLLALFPITMDNSYRARAVRTTSADGRDEVAIDYRDMDTTFVTEADGGVLVYHFDHNWRITQIRRVAADGSTVSLGRREWDKDGKLVADIDAEGNSTLFTYDVRGNLLTVTDALGHRTTFAYNASNQAVSETDPLGNTSRSVYDDAGKLLEQIDALGRVTRYAYDEHGRLSNVIDARGGRKTLAYDTAGRLVSYTDCSQLATFFRYDKQGRLAEMVSPTGASTSYQYDIRGQLAELHLPDGGREQFTFDAEGLLVEYADPKGQRTRYKYDGHCLPVERIDAKKQVVRYVHDKALRVTELINGNGESYHFTYDAESRLSSETGFDGKTTTYFYDRAGRLAARDASGIRTDYARDSVGQLDAKVDADGSVRFAYDALGRLTATRNAVAEHRYHFDAVGQLIGERVAYALSGTFSADGQPQADYAFAMSHSYDELGNRIGTILPNGRQIQTQRYGSGHWHGTMWGRSSIIDVDRDRLHRETGREAGSGTERMRSHRQYDPQSRLTAISLQRGERVLDEQRYLYDRAGQLLQVNDLRHGTTRYTYDPIGQLLSAIQPDISERFAFDPAGNLLDPKVEENDNAVQQSPASVQLHAQPDPGLARSSLPKVTRNLLRSYLDHRYDFDIQGNVVHKAVRAPASANDPGELLLSYDVENRLASAVRHCGGRSISSRYFYDAMGRRIAKVVQTEPACANDRDREITAAADGTTLFLWDGDVLCQEVQPHKTITYLYEPETFVPLALIESDDCAENFSAASVHLAAVPQWRLPPHMDDASQPLLDWFAYQCREEELAFNRHWSARIAMTQQVGNDRVYHYHCDHLGTPTALYDDDGAIVWSARYRAWGRVLRLQASSVKQPLRFPGQYEDDETGLYYNRYRYYDPDCGRYLTQDPIGLAGGRNLYMYVPAPTGFIDPLGLLAQATYTYGVGGRIESVVAHVTSGDLGKGTGTTTASRLQAKAMGCPKDQAGHGLASRLGGGGGLGKVFPQDPNRNMGAYRVWEGQIAGMIRPNRPADIRIDFIYNGQSTRPDEIVYSATVGGRTMTRRFDNPRSCP